MFFRNFLFLFKQMPRVRNKKIKLIIQSARHIIRKGESSFHISENAQSADLEGILKKNKNLQGRNLTKKFTKRKTKNNLYYRR